MATFQEIQERIFYDQNFFMEYLQAVSQKREGEFFQQNGCPVTPRELEEFHRRRAQPGYQPAPKPLEQCPPFSEQDFFASLSLDGPAVIPPQPGDERKTLHFVD